MRAAQEMARKRWKGKTKEERAEHAKLMSDAVKLTPAERKAALGRWVSVIAREVGGRARPVIQGSEVRSLD